MRRTSRSSQGSDGGASQHRYLENFQSLSSEGVCSTAAVAASGTSVSAPDRVSGYGNIHIVDAVSGDRYDVTVALRAPLHSLTSLTHRALHHMVHSLLVTSPDSHLGESTAQLHPLQLLLDGASLDHSDTETLPNGAVVEVHRNVADSSESAMHRSAVPLSERGVSLRPSSAGKATRARQLFLEAAQSGGSGKGNKPGPAQSTAKSTAVFFLSEHPLPHLTRGSAPEGRPLSSGNEATGPFESASSAEFTPPTGAAVPTESLPQGRVAQLFQTHVSSNVGHAVSTPLITSPSGTLRLPANASSAPQGHGGVSLSTPPSEEGTTSSTRQVPLQPAMNHALLPLLDRSNSFSSIDVHSPVHHSGAATGSGVPSSTSSSSPLQPSSVFTSAACRPGSPAVDRKWLESAGHIFPSTTCTAADAATPFSAPRFTSRTSSICEKSAAPGRLTSVQVAWHDASTSHETSRAVLPLVSSVSFPEASSLQTSAPLVSRPPLQSTAQSLYDMQRGSIAAAAAAEQQRLLSRLLQRCQALEEEKATLLTARREALTAQESAGRLRALREAQGKAATVEVDAVRACLGEERDELLDLWLRAVHTPTESHPAMTNEELRKLEDEGGALTLRCLSSIAGYHTQRARLQALRQERLLKEADVARLRWEAHVRRRTAEEKRGCLRVVALLRPPSRRSWLAASVVGSAQSTELESGYAVRVVGGSSAATSDSHSISKSLPNRVVEVVDPLRHVRRCYELWAAYDAGAADEDAGCQRRLFDDQLRPLLEYMCQTGQNVAVLAYGAVGSGKTYALVGPRAAPPPPSPRCGGDSNRAVAIGSLDCGGTRLSSEGDIVGRAAAAGGTAGGVPERRGVACYSDAVGAAIQGQVRASFQRAAAAERSPREEHDGREQTGVEEEDGLLPRTVAWLMEHLRDKSSQSRGSHSLVESVVLSMYEVYNDRVYDLLPTPPLTASGTREQCERPPALGACSRWKDARLVVPHTKKSESVELTELELVPPPSAVGDVPSTSSHSQQQQQQQQQQPAHPRWSVRASEVDVHSTTEALQVIQLGLNRRRTAATLRGSQSSRSHLFLRFRVTVQRPAMPVKASRVVTESASATDAFPPPEATDIGAPLGAAAASADVTTRADKPQGYHFLRAALAAPRDAVPGAKAATLVSSSTCVAELLFTDLAGSGRLELGGASGDALREAQRIHRSLSAVSEVLMALARSHPRCDGVDGADRALRETGESRGGDGVSPALGTAALVQRWEALVGRQGVTLSRSSPVFLQPRFGQHVCDHSTRHSGGHQGSAVLSRRTLALADGHVAGEEAAQWRRGWHPSSTYVPFRACRTTQLLESTLGAPCKLLVLACLQPCSVSEVVLPASMKDRRDSRTLAVAQSLFAHQAPLMLSEVNATLSFAYRIHKASLPPDGAERE